MPRLMPPDWIKELGIVCLLQLYETNTTFVEEWKKARTPYYKQLQQLAKINILDYVTHLPVPSLPKVSNSLFLWSEDKDHLRDYLYRIPPHEIDFGETNKIEKWSRIILDEISPYSETLANLADNWNLRADWAAEELLNIDILKLEQEIYAAAGVTWIDRTTDQGLLEMIGKYERDFPSFHIEVNIGSLFVAGGKERLLTQIDKQLVKIQEDMKNAGAKKFPSAIVKHSRWWFDHYVLRKSYIDIANGIVDIDLNGGPHPENIRKAIISFSSTINIRPLEP